MDGLITAYDGKTEPVHCFRSRGPVHSIKYSEVTDALVTLETLTEKDVQEVDYIFARNEEGRYLSPLLFFVWTIWLCTQPADSRARRARFPSVSSRETTRRVESSHTFYADVLAKLNIDDVITSRL